MTEPTSGPDFAPGYALLPEDFPARLMAVKELTGLSWEGMATAMGVDSRQLRRWRLGAAPNGAAMLALVRLATRVPEGLGRLLDEDLHVERRMRS